MNTVEYLKMEGREEGIQVGMERMKNQAEVSFVESLLKQSDFSVEKIASVVGVTVDFVKQVKSRLNGSR